MTYTTIKRVKNMRYCNCCGHEIPKGAAFCAFCGENYEIQIDYNNCKQSSSWIKSYKLLLWIFFGFCCFFGILSAILCFAAIEQIGISMFFLGLSCIFGMVLLGYFAICLHMIFLEMAEDIRTISINIETLKYRKS